jgi:chromosome segregation ATPase
LRLFFRTYEDETIEPEPNLNVIIGCNGTGQLVTFLLQFIFYSYLGKSTIMCGIYLACGGNPKDLGRSERFGDYVKHGKESGSVELTVYVCF